jgi:hypothetical protein
MTTENAADTSAPNDTTASETLPPQGVDADSPRQMNVHMLRQTAERKTLVLIHGLLGEATALHKAGQIAFFPPERVALFNSLVAALPVIRPTR